MAGQSAHLSVKESRAMQERVQASGSHSKTHGSGSKKSTTSSGDSLHRKKQGKMKDC